MPIIHLTETAEPNVTLYRGDTSKIAQFDISKTDEHALFGQGIYLTSDSTVARDYSFARTYETQAHRPSDVMESKRELIADYIQEIIRTELEWPKMRDQIQKPFRERAWEIERDEHRDTNMEKLRQEMIKATTDGYKKVLNQAKALYKQRAPGFVFTQNTMGQWKMLNKDTWKGYVAHFEVPQSYINRCLHGDRPLTDEAMAMMRQVIMDMTGEGKRFSEKGMIDFRDDDGNGTPFDNWLRLYKTGGSRKAFSDGEINGGKGENPSLEDIMNGTLSGYYIRTEAGHELISGFQKLGYVGVEYDGGKRTAGGHVRGGGGIMHRAFVFWDDQYINSCLDAHTDVAPEAEDGDPLKGITPMKMFKTFRDKKY